MSLEAMESEQKMRASQKTFVSNGANVSAPSEEQIERS